MAPPAAAAVGADRDDTNITDASLLRAFVFDSYRSPTGCGHSVSLRDLVDQMQQAHPKQAPALAHCSCPQCGNAVVYIQEADEDETSRGGVPAAVVRFKFSKLVYQLNVPNSSSSKSKVFNETTQMPWWMFWCSSSGGSGRHTDSNSNKSVPNTAQDRIMSVLGISRGMKVRGTAFV
jgi:hypothetical protein